MGNGGLAQCVQAVTAFQAGNHAPVCMAVGHGDQLPGDPGKIVGFQVEVGQRVQPVCVEPCGDDHQLWRKPFQRGQDVFVEGGPKRYGTGTRRQGRMHQVAHAALGGSAGGLLMGAIGNMAPDKYRVILSQVPFVDVVTTMLDPSIPLTTNEYDEWGNPEQKKFYDYMLTYSPYDNLKQQAYPATFVGTGLWDSQVQYWEPAKYVARLRTLKTDSNPLLLRINMEAGHGGASGRYDYLKEIAFTYSFVLGVLGITQ